jgi:hypothetical protein
VQQLTREEAIAFADAKKWQTMSKKEIAKFQMEQRCLCMPFDVFQEAVEHTVGYPVFTHQMASPTIRRAVQNA